jgi:two-component system, NtrC family, sensor kinase
MPAQHPTRAQLSAELHTLQARLAELEQRLTERDAQLETLTSELHEDIRQRQRIEDLLRRSEQRYRTLFEGAGDAMFILNLNGQFIEANRRACEQLGYSHDKLLCKNLLDVVPVDQIPSVREHLELLRHHGELAFESAYQRQDGVVLAVEVNNRIIEYSGRPAILSAARDITERKRTEEALRRYAAEQAALYAGQQEQYRMLRESQLRLIQTEKMSALGRLVASIAHEINNPLQAVEGCLMLAQSDVEESRLLEADRAEAIRHDLDVAATEVARIARLVERLHDFYRPARTGLQPVELDAAVDAVLALTAKQLQHSNVAVVRHMSSRPLQVTTNVDQLKQVILNLILNAVDAMPQGGTLTISTRSDFFTDGQSTRPAAYLELADTGHGIPAENLARIFEPFFTTKEHGSGLGLSISYELIKALGGEMSAVSQVEVGTTFIIRLPWKAAD